MSLRRSTVRPIVVLIGWALIVSIATIVPITSVAAQTPDAASSSIDALAGVRSSTRSDAPAQVLAFRFDPPRPCVYENSCPEQVGNEDAEDEGPPPRDPYQDARDSRDDGIDKVLDKIEKPVFITYPGYDAQLVGLESFLHLTKGFTEQSATGKEVGGQKVTVYATPIESVWEFTSSEGTEIVTCEETEEFDTGDRDPLCGKEWEHSSSVVGHVSLRVTVKYRIHWTHGYTTGWRVHDEPKWSQTENLIVREALARGIDENLEFDPPDDVRPEVSEPEKVDCGWGAKFAAALIPGLGCEPIQLVWDLFTGFLGGCVGAVIGRIGDLWETVKTAAGDPVGFIKDQVGGLKAMYDLLLEDPLALMEELGRDFFELDEDDDPSTWDAEEWASWAGEFICAKAFDYLTGQASGRLMRYLDGKIRPNGPNGPNNNPDLDPDGPDSDNPDGDNPDGENPDPDAPTCPLRNSSFPAGTQVVMDDGGLLPIEDIRPGDYVLSYNVDTSVWEPKLVLDQWSYDDRGPPATATLVDGSTVTATHDHRFYTPATGEWVELQHLRAGVAVLSPDGPVDVDHVTVGPAHPWTVWELTVADNHNFTVLADETPILVHNCGPTLDEAWADYDGPLSRAEFEDRFNRLEAGTADIPDGGTPGSLDPVTGQPVTYVDADGRIHDLRSPELLAERAAEILGDGDRPIALGSQADTANAAGDHDILAIDDWSPEMNNAWLDEAVAQGRPIELVSPTPPRPGSVFEQELQRLQSKNPPYTQVGNQMVPTPAGAVPNGWEPRVANNGQGTVWQSPGASGNSNSIRIMDPTSRYPNGYVRFYNSNNQPIDLQGRPGDRPSTHIPLQPDGSFELPDGW